MEVLQVGPARARRTRALDVETWPAGVALVVVAVVGLLFGGGTSVAQGVLPAPWAPAANSASSWTLLVFVAVCTVRRRMALSMLLGLVAFVGLVLGYTLVSDLRGYYYSPWLFLAIGIIVGPPLGAGAAATRGSGRGAALGVGLVAGVLLGDCLWGLTRLVPTTGWAYWACAGLLGVGMLVHLVLQRPLRPRVSLPAIPTATVVALLMNLAYLLL